MMRQDILPLSYNQKTIKDAFNKAVETLEHKEQKLREEKQQAVIELLVSLKKVVK